MCNEANRKHDASIESQMRKVPLEPTPETSVEKAGDVLGVVSRRVERDLKRFKEFIETRGRETGAWRGHIEGKKTYPER